MASKRNSICDIWSHKTINSDREIVNSTLGLELYISFSDVNLISSPISLTCQEKAQLGKSLQWFAISARCGRFLRDRNENTKLAAIAQNSL